jgi:hypothetical protein
VKLRVSARHVLISAVMSKGNILIGDTRGFVRVIGQA